MSLATMLDTPDRPGRGRRKPPPGSPETLVREACAARYRRGDVRQGDLAAAFRRTDRTLRRWLAECPPPDAGARGDAAPPIMSSQPPQAVSRESPGGPSAVV